MPTPSEVDALVLIRQLRRKFRDRDDHHRNCSSYEAKPCDCYNQSASDAHLILDELERRLKLERTK